MAKFQPGNRELTLEEKLAYLEREIKRGNRAACSKIPSAHELTLASKKAREKAAYLLHICSNKRGKNESVLIFV